jgi:hypothetical protein
MLRFPYFLDHRLTDNGEVVSLQRWPNLNPHPGILLEFIYVTGTLEPRDTVWLEGLGKLKSQYLHRDSNPRNSGDPNCHLSRKCGIFDIVQPYRPPRPVIGITFFFFFTFMIASWPHFLFWTKFPLDRDSSAYPIRLLCARYLNKTSRE